MSANTIATANHQLLTNSGLPFRDFPTIPVATASRISDILTSAFEGGSNYWYSQLDIHKLPDRYEYKDVQSGGRLQPHGTYWHWSTIVPLLEGGILTFKVAEDIPWKPGKEPSTCPKNYKAQPDGNSAIVHLHRKALFCGLKVFAEKYKHHFAAWVAENDDATTGDVYLQCCCFGEVVYG